MNVIPEVVSNYRVYDGAGSVMLGTGAEYTLPTFSNKTATIDGAGIAGDYEAPVLGHFNAVSTTLNFNIQNRDYASVSGNEESTYVLRGVVQAWDKAQGRTRLMPFRITLRGRPTETNDGTLQVASRTNASVTMSVLYYKFVLDGETLREWDVLNMIYVVNGVDMLAEYRDSM